MSLNNPPALCVAIHDVAPATWRECLKLMQAIRAVADIPLTWLVVPQYHGSTLRSLSCENALDSLLARGHELALHGYTHRDAAAPGRTMSARFLRTVYCRHEGEFAAIDAGEARRRIELGLGWFRERGWPVSGFVAPAWLLNRAVWPVLAEYPFSYTTTYARFHLLEQQHALFAPALVYAARNRIGRIVSMQANSLLATRLASRPLVRLALHPHDAHHPMLVRHAQRMLEQLLVSREALTKEAFARQLAGTPSNTAQTFRPSPSASARSRHSRTDSDQRRPWR